ncbi:MAG TPA: methyl-accepting chemotaxis protein [Oscillatoriales cyanobacterium M59_W2019_021]|nr:methyl-accepting chemotaxis protein [Oscillatoriales cyanobacterium M4454_W2019_049]HIK52044.1 methyl-accepting chemotaxis protein [Oscillatoriales cyanobacterium M59_W2019_021]
MFKNWTVEQRMLLSYLVIGGLFFFVAGIGWMSTHRLKQHIESVASLWKVNEGKTQVDSSENMLAIDLLPAERTAEVERMEKALAQSERGFGEYEAIPRNDRENELYQAVRANWEIWLSDHEKLMALNEQLQNATTEKQQTELLNQIAQQAQYNRQSFDVATASILELIAYNEEQSTSDIRISTILSWLGLFISVGTVLWFRWYFTQTVSKPLGAKIADVVKVAEEISTGNLTTKVDRASSNGEVDGDDVGKLQVAFARMNKNLNSLVKQVQESSIQIMSSATQISASGKQLEATMTEQVASINEVATTSKQIAATTEELVQTIGEVADVSGNTAMSAASGQDRLIEMENTMRQLTDATGSISSKLGAISEKANNISSVVTTITKVADQTNLLSLNAAIEAEKAGEYGSGFAVVAREIRRLADQTAVATLEIEQMVKDMQSAVSSGVMEMDKFTQEVSRGANDVRSIGGQLAQVIEQVQSLTPRFEVVNDGIEGQSIGAQQISQAMAQLSEASRQIASSLRETNNAIDQLNDAATGLQHEVAKFRV